ncbi:MAG TPA: hypothetical protein PK536_09695 [Ignavibacteria bacterium]|nr:hypothetical protein [Bacteroidota bacterium]HRI85703.1 hypothetical protein [Ignavibacteria bacterium]HRJ99598.1 hypothetical protein [Ignavibacteria bacterium]
MLLKKDYHILDDLPFNLKHTSKHPVITNIVKDIWSDLSIDKSIKVSLKQKCLVSTLLNLWISMNTRYYIRYSRRKVYYAGIPKRYRVDYYTYNIMVGIMDSFSSLGLIESEKGFYNPEQDYGQLTKIKPTDLAVSMLQNIKPVYVEDIRPPEFVILKNRETKTKIDYQDTKEIIQMRNELTDYNDLRQSTTFALKNVTIGEAVTHNRFFKLFGITSSTDEWTIRNPYIYRVFNNDFQHGGRYYSGIESQMPKELRAKLTINGSPTVELDFGSMHIRILYQLENKRISGNVYEQLSDGNPLLRGLYKLIALVSINSTTLKKTLEGLRSDILTRHRELLVLFNKVTDEEILGYFNRWKKAHKPIAKYFNSDIGVKLQNYDSQIAAGVIRHFTSKGVPVLVVHDSFVIEDKYKEDLKDIMNSKYLNIIHHKPIIK